MIATSQITITALPIATFSYPGTPYCQTASNPSPVLSPGATAGTFSASPAGLTINSVSGEINLTGSSPGTYTVTNTIPAGNGCPEVTATTNITITALPVATFSYPNASYCQNSTNPSPVFSGGGVAGTFSSSPGLSLNPATGQINLASSTPGTYTVTNTIASSGDVQLVIATATITIDPVAVGGSITPCSSGCMS